MRLVSYEDLRNWECFDADIGIDSASEIREYFIPDFSNWKDRDGYQKAFDRLLRDLKAETEGGSAIVNSSEPHAPSITPFRSPLAHPSDSDAILASEVRTRH